MTSQANLCFLGVREDVERLYLAFDISVLASHQKGFPRSAMEAAAMGLLVVATAIRGGRQVVDEAAIGVLVPVRGPSTLATVIGGLTDDPERGRAKPHGRRRSPSSTIRARSRRRSRSTSVPWPGRDLHAVDIAEDQRIDAARYRSHEACSLKIKHRYASVGHL